MGTSLDFNIFSHASEFWSYWFYKTRAAACVLGHSSFARLEHVRKRKSKLLRQLRVAHTPHDDAGARG